MNLWKDIKTKPSQKTVHAFIEIPKGSRNKYEYWKEKGVFMLKGVFHSPFKCPVNSGVISQTLGDERTPLGILVMMYQPTFLGCIIECKPISIMKMTIEGERCDKILGVPLNDPKFVRINDIQDVSPKFLEKIEYFSGDMKNWKEKTPRF